MSAGAAPCGVITITTDFGLTGPFVGIMKGVILGRLPAARIIDLSHGMAADAPAEAGFWLARSLGWFPPGTVHLAVVDPGVGTSRAILAAAAGGALFVAPDNGLLAPVLAAHPAALIVRVTPAGAARAGVRMEAASATFHGRDILAPLAAELAAGRCTVAGLGEPITAYVPSQLPDAAVTAAGVAGAVVSIDSFGNLISNIGQELLAGVRQPVVRAGSLILPLRRTYAEVPRGDYLALINSIGVVEVARAQGSAAAALALGRGAPVIIEEGDPAP